MPPRLFPARGVTVLAKTNGMHAKAMPAVVFPQELFWDMPRGDSDDHPIGARGR